MSTPSDLEVPVVDLSLSDEEVIPLIARACSAFGFFQIINHELKLLDPFRSAMKSYFDLPHDQKLSYKRNQKNARGFFDDELTKQKRDWKQALDYGVPGSRDWSLPDDAPENACLDGFNVFPKDMPDLRKILIEYFEECAVLSDRIARLMAQGLGMPVECYQDFLRELKDSHSSYLRLNYYPTCSDEEKKEEGTLGISPHRDAGFLTVLYQDYDCHSLQMWHKNEWITIHPLPNSLTINTGDMAMLFSNGRYHAPLHRVLTNDSQKRYSAPFFYNPGYHQWINSGFGDTEPRKYHPCLFGYFRAVRFAGDLTDLGVEIQTSDYEIDEETGEESHHLAKQKVFAKTEGIFSQAFSVESYRPLLVGE